MKYILAAAAHAQQLIADAIGISKEEISNALADCYLTEANHEKAEEAWERFKYELVAEPLPSAKIFFLAGYAAAIKDAVEVAEEEGCDECGCEFYVPAAIKRLLE